MANGRGELEEVAVELNRVSNIFLGEAEIKHIIEQATVMDVDILRFVFGADISEKTIMNY